MSDLTKQLEGLSEQKRRLLLHRLMQQQTAASKAAATRLVQEQTQGPAVLETIALGSGKRQLFFLHSTSGGLGTYMDLAKELKGYTLYGIRKVTCESVAGKPVHMQEMAARYVRMIRSVQPEGPYLLCGYCAAGSIAYEVAQQLTDAGQTIQAVIMLDSFVPKPHVRSRLELLWGMYDVLTGFAGGSKNLTYGEFAARFQDASDMDVMVYFSERMKLLAETQAGIDPQSLYDTYLLRNEIGDAYFAYEPTPARFRVVQIRPAKNISVSPLAGDPTIGWSGLVPDMEVRFVPGHHYSIFLPPLVSGLAAEIRQILEEA